MFHFEKGRITIPSVCLLTNCSCMDIKLLYYNIVYLAQLIWTPRSGLLPILHLLSLDEGHMAPRVEAPITNHLRGYLPHLEKCKAVQICVGRHKSGGLQNLLYFYSLDLNYCEFLKLELTRTYYQCLEFA